MVEPPGLTETAARSRNVIAALHNGQPWQRRQACRWLHGSGPFEDPRYVDALRTLAVDDPDAQRDVFVALATVAPLAHRELARWFAAEGDSSSRGNAMWAIGELGIEGLDLQSVLLAGLMDESLAVAEQAAFALSRQAQHAASAIEVLLHHAHRRSVGTVFGAAAATIAAANHDARQPPDLVGRDLRSDADLLQWAAALMHPLRVAVAHRLAGALLPRWERDHLHDRAPRRALEATMGWLGCPDEDHAALASDAAGYIVCPGSAPAAFEAAHVAKEAACLNDHSAAIRTITRSLAALGLRRANAVLRRGGALDP